jgi:hypothetical protein
MVLLCGCTPRYQYPGTLPAAEKAIASKGFGLVLLVPESRGDTWVRYRVIRDTSGIYITNGTAQVRVESGRVSISGPAEVRAAIKDALGVK